MNTILTLDTIYYIWILKHKLKSFFFQQNMNWNNENTFENKWMNNKWMNKICNFDYYMKLFHIWWL
jgi:hypothetical protein